MTPYDNFGRFVSTDKTDNAIYEVARFTGIPAERIRAWIGAMAMCGYEVRALPSEDKKESLE